MREGRDWTASTLAEAVVGCDYGLNCALGTDRSGIPVLRMGNLFDGRVSFADLKYVAEAAVPTDALLANGEILVNRTNSADRVGKVGLFDGPGKVSFASYLLRLRPRRDHVDPAWLAQLLNSAAYQARLRALATPGVSQVNINRTALLGLAFLRPPLPEQRRIAAILSSIDHAIEKTEAVIAQVEVVKRALMHELLTRGIPGAHSGFKATEIGDVPSAWEVAPLESALDCIIDYRGKTPTKAASGVPLITAKNVRVGRLDVEPREFISEDDYEPWMVRGLPHPDDVLFTTEAPLGNVARMPRYRVALAQRLVALRPTAGRMHSAFLVWMLLHIKPSIDQRGTGSTVKGIKQSVLRRVPVLIPPIREQETIADILDSVERRVLSEMDRAAALINAKAALLEGLLSGRVRTLDSEAAA